MIARRNLTVNHGRLAVLSAVGESSSSIIVVVRQLLLTAVKVSITVGRQLLRVLGRWHTLEEDRVVVAGQVHDVLLFTVRLVLSGQPGGGPVFIGLVGGGGGEGARLPVIQTVHPSPLPRRCLSERDLSVRPQPIIQSLISLGL